MSKKFITEFLPNLTGGELASVQSDLEIKSDAETLTAVESESGRDMSVDGAKLDTLDKINTIADKATVYALTGVAVGTVYKTDDTGQIMEYMGDVLPRYSGFTLAGLSAVDQDGKFYNGTYSFRGMIDGSLTFRCDDAENAAGVPQGFAQDFWLTGNTWQAGAWSSGSGLMDRVNYGQEANYNGYAHPDGNDGAGGDGYYNNSGTGADILQTDFTRTDTESNPYNWKINGVVSVFDNDEKQLLTNLPDTQQVEVVGEGGRIERYNGDNQPDGTIVGGDAHAILITSDALDSNGEPIAGLYLDEGGGIWESQDGLGRLLAYDTTDWVIYDGSNSCWRSETADLTDMPWNLTTWTPEGNGETGTLSQSEVFRHAEAMESNWFTIKNTVYLTVNDAAANGGFDVDGVTVASGTTQGIGWVPVGGYISSNINPTVSTVHLRVDNVNGISSYPNSQSSKKPYAVRTLNEITLPAIFPSGALVTLITTAL